MPPRGDEAERKIGALQLQRFLTSAKVCKAELVRGLNFLSCLISASEAAAMVLTYCFFMTTLAAAPMLTVYPRLSIPAPDRCSSDHLPGATMEEVGPLERGSGAALLASTGLISVTTRLLELAVAHVT